MEYTQKQLEEMVVGKPSRPRAMFFEKAMLDVEESKKEGRRVYEKRIYVQKIVPGVRDSIAYLAQKKDILEFKDEYQEFLRTRQGSQNMVSVAVIPNLDLIHMQELVDMGLGTVQALSQAEMVPVHLEYARQSAIALDAVLKEQHHDEEESKQEAVHKHGTGIERDQNAEVRVERDVSAVGGQEHLHREQRSDAEAGRVDRDAQDSRGLREAGRPHHHQAVDNWSVTFQLG